GSGVAAHLAARQNPAGVVLESPFISIPEVAAPMYRWFPVRQLCRHEFPNLDNVRKISCPILIAHSRDDELVPFSHGQTLFAAANEPKSFFEMTGNHNECIYASGLPYQQALQSFLRRSTAVPFE